MKDFKVLYVEESFDQTMKMEVYYKEAMGFGPQTVKIFLKEPDGDKYLLLEEKIHNDGSNLQEKNVGIKWLKDSQAELSIRGKEMETKKYLVKKLKRKYKAELME